ncbi:MAG: GNAT family N-acetyltransferase [Flavobacteriales bacterium]|nr:GNAT family N-acetyltransferase [Flavobacteriales bacterium]MCB9192990.1 GNAT family N-acetyltransferase [Flavobacteriales bacterium]
MDITIRRAGARDVPAMLALVRELAAFEREPDAVTVTEEDMREAGFGESPVWWGWVAVSGGALVGLALCYERYSTWRGRVGYLEDIVVTDRARGQGIGERLFKACAAECVARGYHHLTWQVLDWNEGAIRFYERLGAEIDEHWVNGRLHREQLQRLAAT